MRILLPSGCPHLASPRSHPCLNPLRRGLSTSVLPLRFFLLSTAAARRGRLKSSLFTAIPFESHPAADPQRRRLVKRKRAHRRARERATTRDPPLTCKVDAHRCLLVFTDLVRLVGNCCIMKNSDKAIPSASKIIFDDESEENDSSSDEEAEIEHELADIPFGELQKARSDGTLALRQKSNPEKKPARANKNRPMEMSSKKPVTRFREVIQAPKKIARDPRFESLCGTFDSEGFKKRYSFIYDEQLPAEKVELQKQLKKSRDPEVIADLKSRISEIEKQLKSASTKNVESQILTAHKKKEREAAKQGKKPFYLKNSEVRKQKLIQKYESLKDTGKLDSYIEKRRKRNATKDHRFMPYRRPVNNE